MNIYISNLDQQVTEAELIQLFGKHGEVKGAEVVLDAFTGKPRGFAYVEMEDDEAATNAIGQLNNLQLNDQAISVEQAKPKETHKGSYAVGNGFAKGTMFQSRYSNSKGKGGRKRF